MAVSKKLMALAAAAMIAIACTLVVLFLLKSNPDDTNPDNTPEYYQEGPLRSYNFCGPRKVIALTFDDGMSRLAPGPKE
jgi:peptidoglycan/xylan/chitin deacetylase (PgdA/CDA1 family)